MLRVTSLDHLVLTVADMDRTLRFYTDVLGMTVEVFGAGRTALKFGVQKINLHPLAGFEPKAKQPTAGSADLCFLVEGDLDAWVAHLGDLVEEGPVARTGATGPIMSLYIRDPDGNLIEVSARA